MAPLTSLRVAALHDLPFSVQTSEATDGTQRAADPVIAPRTVRSTSRPSPGSGVRLPSCRKSEVIVLQLGHRA
jgi:hypothetical protein